MDEIHDLCHKFATELCMVSLRKTRSDMITKFEQTFDPDRRAKVAEGWLIEQGMIGKISELTSEFESIAHHILTFNKPGETYRIGT